MEEMKELEDVLLSVVEKTAKEHVKEEKQLKRIPDISDREARFIAEYCATFNKVYAYRHAFSTKEHADEVSVKADALLNRPEIERRVKNELSKKLDGKLMTAPHFLMKYIEELMDLDMMDFYEADGYTIKPLDQIPVDKRKFIRVGKMTVNAKTGAVYPAYDIPTFSSSLDRLLEVVKLVTTVAAKNPTDTNDAEEARQRRERILNSADLS